MRASFRGWDVGWSRQGTGSWQVQGAAAGFKQKKMPGMPGILSAIHLCIYAVVRCFLCDVNVMWMRFLKGSCCNLNELAVFLEFWN